MTVYQWLHLLTPGDFLLIVGVIFVWFKLDQIVSILTGEEDE